MSQVRLILVTLISASPAILLWDGLIMQGLVAGIVAVALANGRAPFQRCSRSGGRAPSAEAPEPAPTGRELPQRLPAGERLKRETRSRLVAELGLRLRPGVPLQRQSQRDLLWIRDDFLLHEEDFGKVVVHGHTPVYKPEIRSNRINIDTGAYATGQLTCLVLEDNSMNFL